MAPTAHYCHSVTDVSFHKCLPVTRPKLCCENSFRTVQFTAKRAPFHQHSAVAGTYHILLEQQKVTPVPPCSIYPHAAFLKHFCTQRPPHQPHKLHPVPQGYSLTASATRLTQSLRTMLPAKAVEMAGLKLCCSSSPKHEGGNALRTAAQVSSKNNTARNGISVSMFRRDSPLQVQKQLWEKPCSIPQPSSLLFQVL